MLTAWVTKRFRVISQWKHWSHKRNGPDHWKLCYMSCRQNLALFLLLFLFLRGKTFRSKMPNIFSILPYCFGTQLNDQATVQQVAEGGAGGELFRLTAPEIWGTAGFSAYGHQVRLSRGWGWIVITHFYLHLPLSSSSVYLSDPKVAVEEFRQGLEWVRGRMRVNKF